MRVGRRLTRADLERIKREIKQPPKPLPPGRWVTLSCGHESWERISEGASTEWYEREGVCAMCRGRQMLSGYPQDGGAFRQAAGFDG